MDTLRLCELSPGERATVCCLRTAGDMRRRMLDIGLIAGTPVECLGRSPGGDPAGRSVCQTHAILSFPFARRA